MDPYRQGVTWLDEGQAIAEMKQHAQAVRHMVQTCKILVCTMGLSEVWRNREDGSTFFQVPPKHVFDSDKHEFVLTTVEENLENLEGFYQAVKNENPELQVIVTLSPVPLRATFRDTSCLVADTASKAILRVALDLFCTRHPEVIYFPSYEIATRLTAEPYLEDNRHVHPETVNRIMKTFIASYGPELSEE